MPRDWEDPLGWPATTRTMCAGMDWPLVVLHDLPTRAMDKLDAYIGALQDEGVAIDQDFPPDCVPVERGKVVGAVAPYVAASP